ncbi:RNA polymerase sigma-70 factor (ECF subfamily) [Clostridium punense]|uniref:RNA polymerase sigma-70 factor (ECF subfamily) n=1 Tax=Clostridium punense TaxID=1054297 RepID=A0ABS4KBV5_9CLOT|nr:MULTISPECIES: sigma-70 family RNA polymerase sigma factor [Clostridium]EQB88898.1 hypothetical protein M918_22840 [Clostridium sp. BL8]MBP2024094.1 RNA polymerase sigma-70 factor (ECF subfamily) [Clostridium punense]
MFFKTKEQKELEKVFEELVIKEKDNLYRLAYMYVKNGNDAMDILQESILKAYKNLTTVKDNSFLDRWLKRIVVNCSIDYIKRNSKIVYIDDIQTTAGIHKDKNYEDLYEAVDTLSPELRTIIILKYFQGYTIEEVGEILDISISQVKNKLHKALKLLRLEIKITS